MTSELFWNVIGSGVVVLLLIVGVMGLTYLMMSALDPDTRTKPKPKRKPKLFGRNKDIVKDAPRRYVFTMAGGVDMSSEEGRLRRLLWTPEGAQRSVAAIEQTLRNARSVAHQDADDANRTRLQRAAEASENVHVTEALLALGRKL